MVDFKVKIFILLAAVVATDCSPVSQEEYLFIRRRCQQENGLTDDIVDYMLNNHIAKNYSNESEKCFVDCLLVAEGLIQNGQLVVEKVVDNFKEEAKKVGEKLNEDEFRSRLGPCATSVGDTICAKSYNAWVCLAKVLSQGFPTE